MEDKATIISIDIVDEDHSEFKFTFTQSGSHKSWLDWGDGSQREAFEDTDPINVSHVYSEPGQYDILLFAVDEGTIIINEINPDVGFRSMITNLVVGEDVTSIGSNSFSECENLEEVEFLSESTEVGAYAFSACTSLISAKLPANVGIIPEGLFFNCPSLKNCEMPEGVSSFGTNAFYGCSQLRSADLSSAYEVGNYAFHGCRKLTTVNFGESSSKIGNGAFDSCTSLRNLALGSIREIGDRAFSNCRTLTRIVIPESVKTIGDEAFANCRFLKEIKMESRKAPTIASTAVFPDELDYTILVPGGTKRDYAYATNWNIFVSIMKEY